MKIREMGMKMLSKAILSNAKNEANSTCVFIGYQPKMPEKVKKLRQKNG